jgi:hypothetical protein
MANSTRLSKGQSTVILVLVAMLASFMAGVVAFNQMRLIPDLFAQRTNDISTLSKAETRAEHTQERFIPLAARYSMHESTYNITKTFETPAGYTIFSPGSIPAEMPNCILQVDNNDLFLGDSTNGNSSEFAYIYPFYMDCADEMAKYKYGSYNNDLNYRECDVNLRDIDINWDKESGDLELDTIGSLGMTSAECSDDENIANYTSNVQSLDREIKKNNYNSIVFAVHKVTREMENVSEDIEANDNHYGTQSASKSCTYNASTNLKDEAESDAISAAESKLQEIAVAVVEKDHGVGDNSDPHHHDGGGNRGAQYVWDKHSGDTGIDILDMVVDYLVKDLDESLGLKQFSNIKNIESSSTSTCGCYERSCDETYFDYSGSNYACGVSGSCEYNQAKPNPECQTGYNHDGDGNCNDIDRDPCQTSGYSLNDPIVGSDECQNNTDSSDTYSPPTCGSGYTYDSGDNSCEDDSIDATCDNENGVTFDTTGSGSCEVSSPPSPECDENCWEASATARYAAGTIWVWENVTDDENGEIPTSDGWKQLTWNAEYRHDFEDAPWE